jgi:PAS domain S-box-containing protein
MLANNVPALFSYVGRDLRYRYVNHEYARFWQRPASQIVGKTVSELLGPSVFAIARTHVETVLRGSDSVHEIELDRPGGWRVMQVRHVADRGKNGEIRGFFSIGTDITELKHTQQALRERQEHMRAILDTATDGIITFDERGTIVDANPAVERMFGHPHGKLAGKNLKVLMPHFTTMLGGPLDAGEAPRMLIRIEVTGVRKDRSTFPIDFSVRKMEETALFAGIVRDITKQKEAEENLEQHRRNLQIMSSELMLIEERERQRLADDLHDSLGQAVFQARMKLDRPPLNDEAIDDLRTILDEIKRKVNTLTYELSPPILRQMGLVTTIQWLIENLKQQYGLRVRMKGDSSDFPLDERIALVVFRSVREILINVAKHAQTNFAILSVKESNQTLHVMIKDLGAGFDPDDQYQRVSEGHFGLFSVRERLEYLGGSLKVRSAKGKGTTVTLAVPCRT